MSSNTYVLTFDTANIRLFAHTVAFFVCIFTFLVFKVDISQDVRCDKIICFIVCNKKETVMAGICAMTV